MKQNPIVIVTAITGIVIMQIYALSQGIDGKMMAVCVFVIGGLAGYTFDIFKDKLKVILKALLQNGGK